MDETAADEAAISRGIRLLSYGDRQAEEDGIAMLVEMGERVIAPMIKALEEEMGENSRENFITVFMKIGEASVEPLIEALGNESLDVRATAARALGKMKEPRAIGPLIRNLRVDDPEFRLYGAIVNALGNIGTQAIGQIRDMVADGTIRRGDVNNIVHAIRAKLDQMPEKGIVNSSPKPDEIPHTVIRVR